MPAASVSHRLRPSPRPPGRVLKKGSNKRGSSPAAKPGPVSVTVSTPCPCSPAMRTTSRRSAAGTCSSACSAFISRLCTICSSATGSASTVTRRLRAIELRIDARSGAISGSSRYRALRTASCSTTGCCRPAVSGRSTTRRNRPTTSAARRACCAACAMAPRAVARSGGSSSQQALRGLRVGQNAVSGWLSSCAMPAASSPSALSRPTWPSRSSSSARRRCSRWRCRANSAARKAATAAAHPSHPAPGQLAPAHLPHCGHVERLALGRQVLVEVEAPGRRRRLSGLQQVALAVVLEHDPHRARFVCHRPFGPGHHRAQVHLQRETGGFGGQQQQVAAIGEIGVGQHRPARGQRLLFGAAQFLFGPLGACVAAAHGQDLRIERRQALLGRRGRVGRLQQRQRGQHRIVLHRPLAQQPVRDAHVGVEGVAQVIELDARQHHAAACGQQEPYRDPGSETAQLRQHGPHCARASAVTQTRSRPHCNCRRIRPSTSLKMFISGSSRRWCGAGGAGRGRGMSNSACGSIHR